MKYDFEALDAYLCNLRDTKDYAGVSVVLRGPEGILFKKGYGWRNEAKTLPVDENTIFGIASMSKSMTTLACAMLQAEGKLDFSDPVVKYFPEFSIPGTPKECVTLRHLAMHRAGIPPIPPLEWSISMNSVERESDYTKKICESAPNAMERIEQMIDYIANSGAYVPLGAPGEYMSYSNEGYAILSYVVDQAAGIPLEEFLKTRIFEPLGMSRTVLDLDCSEARAFAAGNITSLFEKEDGMLYCDDDWSVLPPYRGCACVKSTAADMARYYQMLSQKGLFEGRQVVDPRAVEILIGREFPETERPYYCFGLDKRLKGGHLICEHTGGLHGVSTQGGFVDSGYSAVVLCNQGNCDTEPFQWACYNALLGLPLEEEHNWAKVSGRTFSAPDVLTGDFVSGEGIPSHCIVKKEADGSLCAEYCDNQLKLLYCQEAVFAGIKQDDGQRFTTIEFLLKDGKAWAARCGSRIYQRAEDGK